MILRRNHEKSVSQLNHTKGIDDSFSGTTAISALLVGTKVYVSNVGDSRAIIVSETAEGRMIAKPLSHDQTPYRKDERERCYKYGARILSMEQIMGYKKATVNWDNLVLGDDIDEGGDPPRIWHPTQRLPGCAFTRSLGDAVAEDLGVISDPEILERELLPSDRFLIIASDGVFEFMTNQMVADLALSKSDPLIACKSIVDEAYSLWLQYEVRTDDITIIIICLENLRKTAPSGSIHSTPEKDSIEIAEERPIRREVSSERKKILIHSNSEYDSDEDETDYMTSQSSIGGAVNHFLQKTSTEIAIIKEAIKMNFLFQHLTVAQLNEIVDVMEKVSVDKDDWIIRQGDKGDRFYIVQTGRYDVRITSNPQGDPTGGVVVHTYEANPGQYPCFGELSLLYGKPRAASVVALENGILWALSRKVFRKVTVRAAYVRKETSSALRRIELFKSMSTSQLQRLTDLLVEDNFAKGDYIIRQGDMGDTFYLLISGKCDCTINQPDGSEKIVFQGNLST
jgi:CRP-like cAMP-binding protein/serine/threonine protein phosphatase PrpC